MATQSVRSEVPVPPSDSPRVLTSTGQVADAFTFQSPEGQNASYSAIGDVASPEAVKGTLGDARHSSRGNTAVPGETIVDNNAGLFGAIRAAIQRQVRYPLRARRAALEGTVRVRLHFASGSAVPTLKIVRSSGHTELDDAAIKAVKRSLPLPHSRGALDVTIPIVFELK